jgi:hypothetical protein
MSNSLARRPNRRAAHPGPIEAGSARIEQLKNNVKTRSPSRKVRARDAFIIGRRAHVVHGRQGHFSDIASTMVLAAFW